MHDPGWVYVVRHGDTDFFKIGHTVKEPIKRLANMQTANPFRLSLHIQHYVPSVALEDRLHEFFKKQNVHGEWFRLCEKDLTRLSDRAWIDRFAVWNYVWGEHPIERTRFTLEDIYIRAAFKGRRSIQKLEPLLSKNMITGKELSASIGLGLYRAVLKHPAIKLERAGPKGPILICAKSVSSLVHDLTTRRSWRYRTSTPATLPHIA
jgi:hypothetical protein